MSPERVIPAPHRNPEVEPFYEAAGEGRFLIRRCTKCSRFHWYPRSCCPFCRGTTEWVEGSGKGKIYSYSVMRRVAAPFVLAYVELAEGPRMMTNLVDCDFDALAIGQDVALVFKAADDGTMVPCFTPVEGRRP
jgi:uncharacterized OB-fold protein